MPSKAKGKAGRSNKRVKTSHTGASSGISRKLTNVDLTVSDREKLDATGFPIEYPVNKDSYRYVLAEKDDHAPLRGLYESNPDRFNNMPLPGFIHRRHCMDAVRLSLPDRDLADGGACRVGWSTSGGHLQAPVGYDHYSYSWRSKHGTKFHNSIGRHYSDEGYGVGDVVGVMIELPYAEIVAANAEPQNKLLLTDSYKDEPLVREAKIRCQFGPKFEFPPDRAVYGPYRAVSERASEESVEIALADMIYNVANDGKPTSGSYYDTWMTSEFGDSLG